MRGSWRGFKGRRDARHRWIEWNDDADTIAEVRNYVLREKIEGGYRRVMW